MTLAEFLLARIAEDEADAQAAMPGPWTLDGGTVMAGHPTNEVVDWAYEENGAHIARWDPARVLAECEAKREIVDIHAGDERRRAFTARSAFLGEGDCQICEDGPGRERDDIEHQQLPCPTLRALALPYAEHPDYRDEWRP